MGLPDDGARLELTFNPGVESYDIGTGYGHIAITAEDLDGTLEKLAGNRIEPEKPPYQVREGGSRLCFVRDPDEYENRIDREVSRLAGSRNLLSDPIAFKRLEGLIWVPRPLRPVNQAVAEFDDQIQFRDFRLRCRLTPHSDGSAHG